MIYGLVWLSESRIRFAVCFGSTTFNSRPNLLVPSKDGISGTVPKTSAEPMDNKKAIRGFKGLKARKSTRVRTLYRLSTKDN